MKRPVFVVGCPRSGTTLLYSLLIASGGFAIYRKETYFYDLLPRFPDLSTPQSQREFRDTFLRGYLGRVPWINVEPFVIDALERCRSASDFLPVLMDGIREAQRMDRWIEATPVHVLHMDAIKQSVPDALFVHVVRDGRDCALSHTRQGWVPTLPWDASRRLGVSALYWEWMVRAGRAFGRAHPRDYFELRFEQLIADPSAVLRSLGLFLDHDLDYERIQRNPVHAMKVPNTSFRDGRDPEHFNPVGRWRETCSPEEIALCEMLVGPFLTELGYKVSQPQTTRARSARARLMRSTYLPYFSFKHWLKARTPLGRFLTSTKVWAEQPRAGERPLMPTANASLADGGAI